MTLRWYDSDEVRAILAEPPYYPDEDEIRTDALLAEAVELDYQALSDWLDSRDRADPFCVEVGE